MPNAEPDAAFLEGAYQALKLRVQGMAKNLTPDKEAKRLTPDEISTLWNTRHMTLEQEWELWKALKPDGTPLYSPEAIGMLVFRDRERLAKSGGNVEPADQIKTANRIAKQEAVKRAANAPPPDPLAQPMTPAGPPEMAGLPLGGQPDGQ